MTEEDKYIINITYTDGTNVGGVKSDDKLRELVELFIKEDAIDGLIMHKTGYKYIRVKESEWKKMKDGKSSE